MGGIVALPLLLVAAFLAWNALSARHTPLEETPTRALPETWIEADAQASPQTPSHTTAAPHPETSVHRPTAGTLAFSARGRPFGRESYELRAAPTGGWVLESHGTFEFRVVIATVRVPFTQSLHTDDALRPSSYTLHVDGVMGFGAQDVVTEIRSGRAVITVNGETTEAPIDADRTFILGTFSTYALLPLLASSRIEDRYDLLVFGGPPHDADAEATEMRVGSPREAEIRSGDVTLAVDAYPLHTGFGASTLVAKDGEFLGLIAGDPDAEGEGLFVYRADYFPDGFELLP